MARLILLQILNGVVVLGGLLLAVAIMERNGARREIELAVAKLDDVLGYLELSCP